mmetsp:Transcript_27368/g.33848  ORF Transcript_27368/g.33848 Transcript_27368/m.33848 type:complete len:92 (+) Transcript_27368:170-445(+)
MRRGNPRRDAVEYGILMTLTTSMCGAVGLMLYMANAQPGGMSSVDLDAKLDFKTAWREIGQVAKGDFSSLQNMKVNANSVDVAAKNQNDKK